MLSHVVPGTSLKDRYRLGRFPLAHKGMGEVWPGQDTLLDRAVIVKFVNAARPDVDLVRRFRREALLTARLDHPGVPAIYDLGEHAGQPYVVLQKIDGITLTDLIGEQGPLPPGWAAAIGAQVCAVLLAARQIGLVHRDIKPSNVMLDTSGAVKVLDFGLAVVRDDDRYSRITLTGHALGTVGYMAPEQVLGEPTDHRTDLYGLGATLFDLLTGSPPFDEVTTTTTLRRQIDGPPPRPTQLRPGIPDELDDLVHTLLAIDPRDRPATAADVYAVLAPFCHDLPPIPGVLTDTAGAVRAYAAIVGRVPPHTRPTATDTAEPTPLDVRLAAKQAEQLHAAGEYRAAARQWRHLAAQHARQHGDDDPLVFDFRLGVARAHRALGEHSRASRLFQELLEDRARAEGPEHPAVLRLRQEIARLSEESSPPAPRQPS
ncbi:Serine/threonine protein kinase [Micromonospora inyonensis]|uniref:non-specific serine/threonine protein kinase n=1 Tax=Micromonospora inyonensis TaxID=47866 RepID=A0A1C6R8Y5_9ACTN|nr:Serine/threonine protein kinase [Micromonospora inyonensis]